jgi:hypothetical protein
VRDPPVGRGGGSPPGEPAGTQLRKTLTKFNYHIYTVIKEILLTNVNKYASIEQFR